MIKINTHKKLIGGKRLRDIGSSRHTSDSDYLIFDSERDLFSHDKTGDYVNAAKQAFFKELWNKELENNEISLNSLVELKCYSFVQHCQNFNFIKADNDEFDIKFLVRELGFNVNFNIVKKYISDGEMSEIMKIIKEMKQ